MVKAKGSRVLVRPDKEVDMVRGFHVPEVAKERPKTGVVVAVGRKCEETEVGEFVVFGKYAGVEFNWEGVGYLIMQEEELIGSLPASAAEAPEVTGEAV